MVSKRVNKGFVAFTFTRLPGIALLVAAGAALGAKKIYDSRK